MGIKADVRKMNEINMMQGRNGKDLSKVVGLSYPTVNAVLSGRRNPSPRVAKKIADALGVDFSDLFEIVEVEHETA